MYVNKLTSGQSSSGGSATKAPAQRARSYLLIYLLFRLVKNLKNKTKNNNKHKQRFLSYTYIIMLHLDSL